MLGVENHLHALPTLHGFYECRNVDDDCIDFFAILLYPDRMPLGFFAVSFPGESMTLSPVTLAQYYSSEISIFDAKPPISEAVTLYLSQLFFFKRPLVVSQRHILNVTESKIS